MRTSYVPVMHCEKMAVSDILFRQRAVTEFFVKVGNSKADFIISIQRPNDKARNGVPNEEAEKSTFFRQS
jgi:hypothetical protein